MREHGIKGNRETRGRRGAGKKGKGEDKAIVGNRGNRGNRRTRGTGEKRGTGGTRETGRTRGLGGKGKNGNRGKGEQEEQK